LDYSVCVKDCPSNYDQELIECYTNDQFLDCEFRWEDVIGDPHPVYGLVKGVYPSEGYVERVCLPDSDSRSWTIDALDEVDDKISKETMGKWLGDVWKIWYTMLIVAGFTVIVAIVYLIMLRYCFGLTIWLSIAVIFCFLLAFGAFCHWSYET